MKRTKNESTKRKLLPTEEVILDIFHNHQVENKTIMIEWASTTDII
jgi:hypothetical protein